MDQTYRTKDIRDEDEGNNDRDGGRQEAGIVIENGGLCACPIPINKSYFL